MTPVQRDLLEDMASFAEGLVTQGWLTERERSLLDDLRSRDSSRLFDPTSHRPLVAAFFGGTGVGKSSLLNQLAGQDLARTGVERPTSREISLYLHESIAFKALPNDLPVEDVRLARHANEAHRQILWVDMPDIDSVDGANRALVLDWLPHVDVLIYVVSPERYRDDKGWQLLSAHGGDHAWLFILNQWDRGVEIQHEDFRRLLMDSGFSDPIILRTVARSTSPDPTGGIHEMTTLLGELSSRHLLAQIDAHSDVAQLQGLSEVVSLWHASLQGERRFIELVKAWELIWQEAVNDLMVGMEWSFVALIRVMTARLSGSTNLDTVPPGSDDRKPETSPHLWDEWAQGRVQDALSQLLVLAGENGLPVPPLKARLDAVQEGVGRHVIQRGQLKLRHALAMPGNAFQRSALRVAGALSFLLPLSAFVWASYQVVAGYYQSALQQQEYLGTDFAIHTVLLIGLAWLGPWFIYSRLRPSVEASALKGLRSGVREALVNEGETVRAGLEAASSEQERCLARLSLLEEEIRRQTDSADREYAPLVRRMIMKSQSPN